MGKLMSVELEILHAVPVSGVLRPYAYAVWTDREGVVQMGPVRYRHARTKPCREFTRDASEWEYSCSPFPGAWSNHVPESAILRVRHLAAMSLHTMDCVCPGTQWDAHCPAPDCTTPDRRR